MRSNLFVLDLKTEFFHKTKHYRIGNKMMKLQHRIKVLMVFPEFPPSFWSFEEAVLLMNLKATMPPTGLATLAAMLSVDIFDVMPIVDMNVEPLTDEDIEKADVVMFSAMVVQKDSLREVIARVKRLGKKVVVGGPYATMCPDEVLAMGADHLVLGEAEMTLAPFVEDFLAGKAEKIYSEESLLSRVTVSLNKECKPDITTTPIPRWDRLKIFLYSSLAIQYSRGCPFNCNFCIVTKLNGHESRVKTPEQMIAELDTIRITGWRGSIFIVDDNFIGNRNQVRKFLAVLIEWQKKHGYPFSFFTEASIDLANENMRDIRKMMVLAGFKDVFVGIESTSLEVLLKMNKGQNRGDLGEKVRILQESGFEVSAGFIVGSDLDSVTVFGDLFQFIQENGIVIPMPGLLMALEGSDLFTDLTKEGRIISNSSGDNTHRFKLNFVPKLDEKFLIDGYVDLLRRLFSPKNYFARCWTLRRRRGKHPKMGKINGNWVHATAVVFYRNLIRKPNWQFAKFMFGTVLTSPWNLSEAVTQAVKLEHFKKITKATVSAHKYPQKVETIAERFHRRVVKIRGGSDKRLKKLAKLRRKYFAKALRRYRTLEPHLRADAKKALVNLRLRLHEYAEKYRKKWQS